LKEFIEAAAMGGGRVYAVRQEKIKGEGGKPLSVSGFYGLVQRFNEAIKNWKGT